MYAHQGPVLGVTWNKDGTRVFSGGADSAVRMYDLQSGQAQQVAQHDAPVKSVRWVETPQGGLLATGSWDRSVKVCLLLLLLLFLVVRVGATTAGGGGVRHVLPLRR